ncbi:hypothetical protein COW36_04845 [bacterium (Candidatus Blackallbacteria) CG17_big_fil_post_rev_8_21_14_2_50_48_46]|uniref:Uncharacterized protein n=1 Tax=bacterium (Candidatus Blackallbacteria) CG17_big_fil_post_rev_8_21_14_2_50_48_46 TaxID=2014261 RepID=A0A2M7G950_9BACT|nr:MAG: hypothetical protein COW64_04100 [bacterium (Candidatus Blackallbacteria) CG18_big_fil_WC_8_21_14_2_50_49_26]PIW18623.1 MAG: hypothetical protein COW36_04845 [bacterium (Candidatus Blackallbacteria) CG17_big_fil_post_rev_8_21_14_2_50_48_46]PIW46391.1 MAG: hypothetical protein COW20_15835 [bacterium (Candidatus Blackallbacteria) CG13_big_fil_rev_8_21_14_2_50_49_14]
MPEQLPQAKSKLRFQAQWLVNARYDLSLFVFSGLLSFAFWGLYELFKRWGYHPTGQAVLMTYFIFTALLDLPHIFQTFSRTHADPIEFKRHPHLYTWGLALILLSGFFFESSGFEPWAIGLVSLYGSWHIVRQHHGFVRLYHSLNEPERSLDHRLDSLCLQIALLACVVYDYVELSDEPLTRLTVYGSHFGYFPVVPEEIGNLAIALGWMAFGIFILRQLHLASQGEALNLPKLLVMGMALLTHFCIFVIASVPFLVAEALETAYHNVQYHGFIAIYQQRRFPEIRWIAWRWLGAALLYGLIAGCIEILGYTQSLFYLLFTPFSMLTLFHYYIDGKIWKFSQSPELSLLFKPGRVTELPVSGTLREEIPLGKNEC